MVGDFYPLSPHDQSEFQRHGDQFDNPELRAGCAILFRRGQCSDVTKSIRLKDVEPRAAYEVADLDVATSAKVSGQELVERGLTVEIKDKPGAAIIFYQCPQ
jgi:hypothetical protein